MDWRTTTYAAVIFGVLGAGGFGLQRGRVSDLRGDNTDLRAKNTDLRTAISDARLEAADIAREAAEKVAERDTLIATIRAECAATVARLENDRDAYQRGMTGEAHWLGIGELLDHHHAEAMRAWERIEALLAEREPG